MKTKKKYKKQVLKLLKELDTAEYTLLETMTNLMLLKEMKENNINFKEGDTFSFEDNIFDLVYIATKITSARGRPNIIAWAFLCSLFNSSA